MSELLPSLGVLADRVRVERDQLQRHADAIDTKAGLMLGFAGLLATLPTITSALADVGRMLAALAGLIALLALFPRPFSALEMLEVRRQYLAAEADFTRLDLLDADLEMHQRDSAALRSKAKLLKVAMVVVTLAVLVLAGAILSAGGTHG